MHMVKTENPIVKSSTRNIEFPCNFVDILIEEIIIISRDDLVDVFFCPGVDFLTIGTCLDGMHNWQQRTITKMVLNSHY